MPAKFEHIPRCSLSSRHYRSGPTSSLLGFQPHCVNFIASPRMPTSSRRLSAEPTSSPRRYTSTITTLCHRQADLHRHRHTNIVALRIPSCAGIALPSLHRANVDCASSPDCPISSRWLPRGLGLTAPTSFITSVDPRASPRHVGRAMS